MFKMYFLIPDCSNAFVFLPLINVNIPCDSLLDFHLIYIESYLKLTDETLNKQRNPTFPSSNLCLWGEEAVEYGFCFELWRLSWEGDNNAQILMDK